MNQQLPVDEPIAASSPKKAKGRKRLPVVIGVGVLLLILGTAAAVFLVADQKRVKQAAVQAQCGGSNAEAAYTALAAGDQKALLSQAETVRTTEGYASNLTCLYIVTEADLALGDGAAATEHNNQLQSLARQGDQALDPAFSNSAARIKSTDDATVLLQNFKMDTDSDSNDPEGVSADV